MHQYISMTRQIVHEALEISLKLFKIMVPVILVVKVLKELGMVEFLGTLLAPSMKLVGLPGSMGLVIATTMVTSVYGGMIAFVALCTDNPLTVAQTTVLTSMMLVAHSLPVELRIAQKAGVRLHVMGILRIAGAFGLGWCLNEVYTRGQWLQELNVVSWLPPAEDPSLTAWLVGQLKSLAVIYLAILGLLVVLKILGRLGITNFMIKCLNPVLTLLGIGRSASPITIIGMTLGLAYGGGLIIQEAKSGRIGKRDIFFSLSLMGLSHSLIEDTLLMMILGGHISGILWGRVAFSLVCIYLLVQWISRLSEAAFDRHFFHEESAAPAVNRFFGLRHLFQGRK